MTYLRKELSVYAGSTANYMVNNNFNLRSHEKQTLTPIIDRERIHCGFSMGRNEMREMGPNRYKGSRHLPAFWYLNFFATTHRLGCQNLFEGGGLHKLRYEGSCFFSKHLRVTPLSRGNGTNYNRGSRSLVRSSVKIGTIKGLTP
jgi:hypothetical protein